MISNWPNVSFSGRLLLIRYLKSYCFHENTLPFNYNQSSILSIQTSAFQFPSAKFDNTQPRSKCRQFCLSTKAFPTNPSNKLPQLPQITRATKNNYPRKYLLPYQSHSGSSPSSWQPRLSIRFTGDHISAKCIPRRNLLASKSNP